MAFYKRIYIEKLYYDLLCNKPSFDIVEEKDPYAVVNDGIMQGFRFFDVEDYNSESERFVCRRVDYSNWVYFGKRLSLDEFKSEYYKALSENKKDKFIIRNPLIFNDIDLLSFIEERGYKYVCFTQKGTFLPMHDEDITYDELLQLKKENNDVKKILKI